MDEDDVIEDEDGEDLFGDGMLECVIQFISYIEIRGLMK